MARAMCRKMDRETPRCSKRVVWVSFFSVSGVVWVVLEESQEHCAIVAKNEAPWGLNVSVLFMFLSHSGD